MNEDADTAARKPDKSEEKYRRIRFSIDVETSATDEDFVKEATEKAGFEKGGPADALAYLLYEALLEPDYFLDKFPPSTSLAIEYVETEDL